MSDELQQQYEESLKHMKKLGFYVMEMEWKKAKTEADAHQEALCAGLLAICNQNQVIIGMLQSYHRYLKEVHRHIKEMHEGAQHP